MTAPDSPAPEPLHSSNGPRPETSLTLLERLRAKDGDAWHTMVQLYGPLLHYWCSRNGLRGSDAEDVAQEVFRTAATNLEKFHRDRPGDSFRGWLRGITRNMVLQHFRNDRRHPRAAGGTDAHLQMQNLENVSADTEDDDPADELDGLRRRALELVRSEFEERTWQMFWMTVIDGRSPVDIAAERGVTAAAVRMAKSRVLHRLKEEFGNLIQ